MELYTFSRHSIQGAAVYAATVQAMLAEREQGGFMPSKEPYSESRTSTPDAGASLKRVERFLRLLTWQMVFVLVLLFYLALMRPQAGRYQFYVAGEDVWMFD